MSPDGKTVVLGDANNDGVEIAFWDFETGALKRVLAGHSSGSCYVFALAFAPDGKTLASAGGVHEQYGEVLLWDVDTGQIKHRCKAGKHHVTAIRFRRTAKHSVCSRSAIPNVRFFDTSTGRLQRELKLKTDATSMIGGQVEWIFLDDLKYTATRR